MGFTMDCILKHLRKSEGYSQKKLAEKIGISRQTIIKYEKGECKLPSTVIKKFAKLFDVDYSCFIENKIPQELTYEIIPSNLNKNDEIQMRISIPQENIEKFKHVLLYILAKVGAKPNVGQTVLYKLLYFIDFDYYELYEEQLMGLQYIKNNFGPTPVDFKKMIDEMVQNQELEEVKTKFFEKDQTKYLPISEPNLSLFSAHEIKHIDRILEKHSDKTAKELSNLSHKDIPWIAAKMKEVIKYNAVFYRNDDTSVRAYENEL
jgi:transcriptional regulator with XRE-family HTH domain